MSKNLNRGEVVKKTAFLCAPRKIKPALYVFVGEENRFIEGLVNSAAGKARGCLCARVCLYVWLWKLPCLLTCLWIWETSILLMFLKPPLTAYRQCSDWLQTLHFQRGNRKKPKHVASHMYTNVAYSFCLQMAGTTGKDCHNAAKNRRLLLSE